MMKSLRFLLAVFVSLQVTFGAAALLSGCTDDTKTDKTLVKESQADKDENQKIMDNMRKSLEGKKGSKSISPK
jgi:hypothetical protein